MQEQINNINHTMEQNQLIFRTPPGSRLIPAGETVRLNDNLPDGGIQVANYKTIRMYARCRPDGTIPVSFRIFVLDAEEDELIFLLDGFTLSPEGETLSKIYEVPGRSLVVFAFGDPGTGYTGIDFGIIGFGPCSCLTPPYYNCTNQNSGRY